MKNIQACFSIALLGTALWAQTPSASSADGSTSQVQQPRLQRFRQQLEAANERQNAEGVARPQATPQVTARQEAMADELRLAYFKGIRDYIQRYALTPASCSEIVEAALSANKELGEKFMKAMVGSKPTTSAEAAQAIEKFRNETHLWAMQMALEAKYPDPSAYQPKVDAKKTKR